MFFGACVKIEEEDGQEQQYQLVGRDEFDVSQGQISIDSPLARALLGKQVDDEISIMRPDTDRESLYWITAIEYRPYEAYSLTYDAITWVISTNTRSRAQA